MVADERERDEDAPDGLRQDRARGREARARRRRGRRRRRRPRAGRASAPSVVDAATRSSASSNVPRRSMTPQEAIATKRAPERDAPAELARVAHQAASRRATRAASWPRRGRAGGDCRGPGGGAARPWGLGRGACRLRRSPPPGPETGPRAARAGLRRARGMRGRRAVGDRFPGVRLAHCKAVAADPGWGLPNAPDGLATLGARH